MELKRPDGLPLIIAEVGFNHEGDLDQAEAMIRAAAEAGADLVKFQTFKALDLSLPDTPHFELIRKGEMDLPAMRRLAAAATACGISFFSTPFSLEAVDMLEDVGVGLYKVASMDLTNKPLLARIAATGKPVILSTGMGLISEIAQTLEFLEAEGAPEVALLHCISKYPAPAETLNLAAIGHLQDIFGVRVGFSDHYPGTDACLAAFFHGAQIIETHFTLDASRPGGDHGHSVEPGMLRELIERMRLFRTMAGDRDFYRRRPDRAEAGLYRRGVYAARDLAKGGRVGASDLLFCRPPSELTPNDLEWMSGMVLVRDVAAHQPLARGDFGDDR